MLVRKLCLMTVLSLFSYGSVADGQVPVLLNGNQEVEEWTDLTSANHPGFPGFGNLEDLWPSAIESNSGSTGNASFNKQSGGGYPSGGSIYPHFTPGTFVISSDTGLSDVSQVVLQVDSGSGGYNAPTLSFNGGNQLLAADFVDAFEGGFVSGFGGPLSPTTNVVAQWDLSSFADDISSFEVLFTSAEDADAIFQLNLDSSDGVFARVQAVPEPGAFACLLFGSFALAGLRRRTS